jgi:hypothetical protein
MIFLHPSHNRHSFFPCILPIIQLILISFSVLILGMPGFAQKVTTIRIDANAPFTEPAPASYNPGSAKSPSGSVIGLNSRYLTLNGAPWLPVMGEFHFSRYPRAQWEEELLKMKAAVVNLVSAYIIWIHHEELKGQTDWTAQRDLRADCPVAAETVIDAGTRAVHNDLKQSVFWSEPVFQSGLRKPSLFDKEGNVLPVISVFDHSPP